jgi:hypothetical protein
VLQNMGDSIPPISANSAKNFVQPKRKFRGKWFIIAALLILTSWQLFFRPLPKPVLYFIADHAGGWMINQGGDNYTGAQGSAKRLVNLWVEQSVMAQVHDQLPSRGNLNDLALIKKRLLQIHPLMINQMDLPHEEILSSNALTGVGKCTGLNMAAAQLLAHDFDRVEMIAIDGDMPDSGHTFARLWSPQIGDWVYFDIWTAQIQVFRSTSRGAIYLWKYPAILSPEDQVYASRTKPMHDLAPRGHMRLKLQDSFGGYFLYRLGNLISHGSTWEKDVLPSTETLFIAPEPKLPPEVMPKLSVNQSTQGANFVTARLDHMFGNLTQAKTGYAHVAAASDSTNSTIQAASKIFARRLSKTVAAD